MRLWTLPCIGLASLVACASPAHGQQSPATPQAASLNAATAGVPTATPGAADEAVNEHPRNSLAVTTGVDLLATSAYVWRGFVPVTDLSFQPNAWIKVGNVTLSSWMNVASTRPLGDHLTEHDFTADYTVTRGHVSISAGYVNYVFPDLSSDRVSHEFYAGVAHDSYLAPSVRVYQDVHVGSGTYVSLGASHTYDLPGQQGTLTPSLALGYNHRQWIDASTFSDLSVGLKAKLPTPLARVSLAPFVTYSRSLAREFFPSRVYYGLGLSLQ